MPGDYFEFWAQNMWNILILTFGDLAFFSRAMDLESAFVSFLITFPPTRITCHIYTFEIQNSGDFSKQFEIQGPLTLIRHRSVSGPWGSEGPDVRSRRKPEPEYKNSFF